MPETPRFHMPRASASDQLRAVASVAHVQAPKPLPEPTGSQPYRLDLSAILGADAMDAIIAAGKVVFQTVGDSGGVKDPDYQLNVATAMESAFTALNPAPSFFYHLGDVVYYYGQRSNYYSQFYDPYIHYPAPIFAIPGNHDGDITPEDDIKDPLETTSLDGFVANFCAPSAVHMPEASESPRLAMTQPNVYWTLTTPFATIIGLYTNVPEHGVVDADQAAWFTKEVKQADPAKALIVASHHPIYSADAFHGSSPNIGQVLDSAFTAANRSADLVLNGHVHNYQRLTATSNGRPLTYIVAGAGGYYNLHHIGHDETGHPPPPNWTDPELGVVLNTYNQSDYGFLTLAVSSTEIQGTYTAVSKPATPGGPAPTRTVDQFTIPLGS